MPFNLEAWADGACRRNGRPDAVGGAGVWFPRFREGCQSEPLPRFPQPTNQRAELTAIILALKGALQKQSDVCSNNAYPPFFSITVHTDSEYSVNCMNEWIERWIPYWILQDGSPVKNRDLLEEAHNLRLRIEQSFNGARVNFKWVPREDNQQADKLANDACDEAERALYGY
ncbi:ribonuclease H-like domain-containing protein [Mycena galericulata]|nr:ribonuclease H-like domain-containing protein [Mycena galericulata]